jgi:hypothetical protein
VIALETHLPDPPLRPSRFVAYGAVSLACACLAVSGLLVKDGIDGRGPLAGVGAVCIAPMLVLLAIAQAVAVFGRSAGAAWSVAIVGFACCVPLLPVAAAGGVLGLAVFVPFLVGAIGNITWARALGRHRIRAQGFPVLQPRAHR